MDDLESPIDAVSLADDVSGAPASGTVVSHASSLDPADVLERLRRGEPIQDARVVDLKLKGDFSLPVRFRNVTLVQAVIDRANFADEVDLRQAVDDRRADQRLGVHLGLRRSPG